MEVTLSAISNIYTNQICILSTLGVGADVDFQPHTNSSDNVQSYPRVFLGRCAERQGKPYVALSEELKDHISFFSVQNKFVRSEAKVDESVLDKLSGWRDLPDECRKLFLK